jgi:hypothetical protein
MDEANSSTVPRAPKIASSLDLRSPVNKDEVPLSPVRVYTLNLVPSSVAFGEDLQCKIITNLPSDNINMITNSRREF